MTTDPSGGPSAVGANPRRSLGGRLRRLRVDRFGEDDRGAATLAGHLGVPVRTWLNYEAGVTIPGDVLLALMELTGVEPRWLLGRGGAAGRA